MIRNTTQSERNEEQVDKIVIGVVARWQPFQTRYLFTTGRFGNNGRRPLGWTMNNGCVVPKDRKEYNVDHHRRPTRDIETSDRTSKRIKLPFVSYLNVRWVGLSDQTCWKSFQVENFFGNKFKQRQETETNE